MGSAITSGPVNPSKKVKIPIQSHFFSIGGILFGGKNKKNNSFFLSIDWPLAPALSKQLVL